MEYRDNAFFNENDTYKFEGGMRMFESKVEFSKGNWWTVESLNYKASTVRCEKLTTKNK